MTKLFHGVLFTLAAFAWRCRRMPARAEARSPPTVEKNSRNDNTIYVGINWNFGVRDGATAVLGYRDAQVDKHSNVDGWKVEATFVLSGAPMGFGELRAKYLKGERDVQGELGLGFSGAHEAFLLERRRPGPVRQRQRRLPVRQGLAVLDRRQHPGQGEEAEEDEDLSAGVHPRAATSASSTD